MLKSRRQNADISEKSVDSFTAYFVVTVLYTVFNNKYYDRISEVLLCLNIHFCQKLHLAILFHVLHSLTKRNSPNFCHIQFFFLQVLANFFFRGVFLGMLLECRTSNEVFLHIYGGGPAIPVLCKDVDVEPDPLISARITTTIIQSSQKNRFLTPSEQSINHKDKKGWGKVLQVGLLVMYSRPTVQIKDRREKSLPNWPRLFPFFV